MLHTDCRIKQFVFSLILGRQSDTDIDMTLQFPVVHVRICHFSNADFYIVNKYVERIAWAF